MAMTITEACISCGACEPECPRSCITEGDPIFVIDAECCTECIDEGGPKCVPVCPVDCIIKLIVKK
jgi:ferredoxin